MSTSEAGGTPPTQPVFFGRPPRPPKITARGIEDQPDDPNRTVFISDPVVVADLAEALNLKPFKIVARLLEIGLFRHPDEAIDFDVAWWIALEYGYRAERTNPGFLTA